MAQRDLATGRGVPIFDLPVVGRSYAVGRFLVLLLKSHLNCPVRFCDDFCSFAPAIAGARLGFYLGETSVSFSGFFNYVGAIVLVLHLWVVL
jgi:hypothetical protein